MKKSFSLVIGLLVFWVPVNFICLFNFDESGQILNLWCLEGYIAIKTLNWKVLGIWLYTSLAMPKTYWFEFYLY